MIHAHLTARVTHEPQRRIGDGGESMLRVRCRSGRTKVVLELTGQDALRTVLVGDVAVAEGTAIVTTFSKWTNSASKPTALLVVRVEKLSITPAESPEPQPFNGDRKNNHG